MGGIETVIMARRGRQRYAPAWIVLIAAFPIASILAAPAMAQAPDRRPDEIGGYPTTHVVVKFKPAVARALRDGAAAGPAAAQAARVRNPADRKAVPAPGALTPALQRTWTRWGASGIRPVFPGPFRYPDLAAKHGLADYFVIEVPTGTDTPTMAAEFAAHRLEVESAGVDAIGGVAACPVALPDDSRLGLQWGMHNTGQPILAVPGTADADIDAAEAWEMHTGIPDGAVIAILDSGVSWHPEFGDRLLPGYNSASGADPTDTEDRCGAGHGTHVTGIAAAAGNDSVGVAGVNWAASILPVKVLDPACCQNPCDPSCPFDDPCCRRICVACPCNGQALDLADGIRWAADWPCNDSTEPCDESRQVHVINMSLQYNGLGPFAATLLESAVDYAHDAGILLVAASGNHSLPNPAYPARLNNCMAITATNNRDEFADFSNYGPEVDAAAPGEDVYSTVRYSNYAYNFGTSMASPHVAGVASLLKSAVPELTNVQLKKLITFYADDLGPPCWDEEFGHGRLNAHRSLTTAVGGGILASSHDSCSVDPRIPHAPDNASVLMGWREFELEFLGDASGLTPDDFAVFADGSAAGAPAVAGVDVIDQTRVRVELDTVIEPKIWTTIVHVATGTSVRLAALPGDVNRSGVTDLADIASLIATAPNRSTWRLLSVDIDRSGGLAPADLLMLVDLLEGVGEFEPYLGATLPP